MIWWSPTFLFSNSVLCTHHSDGMNFTLLSIIVMILLVLSSLLDCKCSLSVCLPCFKDRFLLRSWRKRGSGVHFKGKSWIALPLIVSTSHSASSGVMWRRLHFFSLPSPLASCRPLMPSCYGQHIFTGDIDRLPTQHSTQLRSEHPCPKVPRPSPLQRIFPREKGTFSSSVPVSCCRLRLSFPSSYLQTSLSCGPTPSLSLWCSIEIQVFSLSFTEKLSSLCVEHI